ncbi:hypothetical protein D3C81_1307660 [compost metagenome]
MDTLTARPDGALASPASLRNAEPILRLLRAHLPKNGRVLEIASGSGQHAVFFSSALPGLDWTPSDPSADARASIAAWMAEVGRTERLQTPLALDCLEEATWPEAQYDAVVCINMIHISPWAATKGLMKLAERALPRPGGLLYLYGPYRETEVPLAPSNEVFDASLKSRDAAWGLRDRDEVVALARSHGLALALRTEMPANNISLLFRRV